MVPPGVPAPLAIAGTEGLLVTYARCCFPVPYDPIFAFLSAGRGVVIHRENCVNVEDYRKHPENWLPVSWQTAPDRLFSSEIRVYVVNRTGVLAAVAAAIASAETNIDHVSIDEQDSDTVGADLRAARARPPAPRASGAYHPPHAGRDAGDAHHRSSCARCACRRPARRSGRRRRRGRC
jgi:hypothetical protein